VIFEAYRFNAIESRNRLGTISGKSSHQRYLHALETFAERFAQKLLFPESVAAKLGEASTGLNTGPFYGMWKRNRKRFPTAAQQLFGTDTPAPLEYIVKSEELCGM
jgi:hypothetical protein